MLGAGKQDRLGCPARVAVRAAVVLMGGLPIAGALVMVLGPSASASALSPAQAVRASISTGARQASVHWVSSAVVSGVSTELDTQAGGSSGWQTISESQGTTSAQLTIELVKGAAYMIGDAGGLYLQGLTQAPASAEAGKWISVPSSSRVYPPAVAGLTVASTMQELQMSGAVKAVAAIEFQGRRDPGYQGKTKSSPGLPSASETLYVSSTGSHLPVKVLSDGSTTVFSQWGSAVNVTTPNGAVVLRSSWLRSG